MAWPRIDTLRACVNGVQHDTPGPYAHHPDGWCRECGQPQVTRESLSAERMGTLATLLKGPILLRGLPREAIGGYIALEADRYAIYVPEAAEWRITDKGRALLAEKES